MIRPPVVPPVPRDAGPARRPRRLEVFSAEPSRVQLTWGRLGPGPARVACADTVEEVATDGGPGALILDRLPVGRDLTVEVTGDAVPERVSLPVRTLTPPPGEELFRLATLNDLHLGLETFGYLGRMRERPAPVEHHPVRCARAAVDEALAWGARALVVKGDLTDASRPEHWRLVGEVLRDVEVPIEVVPGNHETNDRSTTDPTAGAMLHGLRVVRGVQVSDHPGLRLITADTTIPGTDRGRILPLGEQVLSAASRAGDRGVLLAVHHHPQRWRVPTFLPPGIPGPEARRFLEQLGTAHPATLVTTGHTHRHRRQAHGPVVVTEVGSTKDYPGTWAGYVVHEGGIRQVVRRVMEPSCIRWTEWSRRAALGMWGHWSPGDLDQRCFTHPWPATGP